MSNPYRQIHALYTCSQGHRHRAQVSLPVKAPPEGVPLSHSLPFCATEARHPTHPERGAWHTFVVRTHWPFTKIWHSVDSVRAARDQSCQKYTFSYPPDLHLSESHFSLTFRRYFFRVPSVSSWFARAPIRNDSFTPNSRETWDWLATKKCPNSRLRVAVTRELVGKVVCSTYVTHKQVISYSWILAITRAYSPLKLISSMTAFNRQKRS